MVVSILDQSFEDQENMDAVVQTTFNRYALYCPICGRMSCSYLRDDEPCVHVVYLYFDDVQNFAHIVNAMLMSLMRISNTWSDIPTEG